MRKFISFLAGVMSGAVVGAAVALLFAPMTGESMQQELSVKFEQLKKEIETAMSEREAKLRADFEQLKKSV
ncbi:MAG: YtxH domain-containing protein [Chloroflexota bacterium]